MTAARFGRRLRTMDAQGAECADFYRVIVAGGHTGSARCFMSGVFTLEEALREALGGHAELVAFTLFDAERVVLEVYRDGARAEVASLIPRLRWRLDDGRVLARGESPGDITCNGAPLDLGVAIDAVIDGDARLFFDGPLPALEVAPSRDAPGEVTLHNGARQPHGWVGDFFSGGAFERTHGGA